MSNILIKRRAEAQFRKQPGIEDGQTDKTGMSDYESGADLVTAKIAYLKGLRLARDAAAAAVPPPVVAVKKPGRTKKQKARPGISLSDWRRSHDASGHRS